MARLRPITGIETFHGAGHHPMLLREKVAQVIIAITALVSLLVGLVIVIVVELGVLISRKGNT
jgi:hypothetical protein